MLRVLLQARHLDLPDVSFKSEGDVFTVMSWDLASLQVIAHMIRDAVAAPDLARKLMESAYLRTTRLASRPILAFVSQTSDPHQSQAREFG